MYQNSNFRSSIRGGNRRSFRPSAGGRFNRPKSFSSHSRGNARKVSKLIIDPTLFIKKSSIELQPLPASISHRSFADFNLTNPVKQNILDHGYQTPTPVQDQAIGPILEGRDLIGVANTGTGKTAAFLIPIINTIFQKRNDKALIIAPTRELAVQINEEFRLFAKDLKVYSTLVIGGANMHRQIYDIRRNPHVVVGTPGRLKDLIQHNILRLDDFSIFVLDEVDLMVDIGFINDVKYFISLLPTVRQSLFFSATIPPKVNQLLASFVKNPVTVSVKVQETAVNVDQDVINVPDRSKKIDLLHDLLIKDGFDKVLIFNRTKHGVDKLFRELDFRGFKVGAIHGNKTQGQRLRILDSFKRDQIQILLATDVASRGLDIDNVTHVINYDLPETYEDYVHRIGRTGRAEKKGCALTFIDTQYTP